MMRGHQQTSAGRFIEMIREGVDGDSKLVADLADCFRYMLDHDEFGEVEVGDLPAFEPGVQFLLLHSVRFGTTFAADEATLYHVSNADGSFVGLYGIQDHADGRAAGEPGLSIETTGVHTDPSPTGLIDPLHEAPGGGPQNLGENLQYIYDRRDAFLDGEITAADLPRADQITRTAVLLAVLFGILFEQSHPGLQGVFRDDHLIKIYHGSATATDRADELGEGHYVQRLSVADGDLGPSDLLTEMPDIPAADGG